MEGSLRRYVIGEPSDDYRSPGLPAKIGDLGLPLRSVCQLDPD